MRQPKMSGGVAKMNKTESIRQEGLSWGCGKSGASGE
jgi:hypothetical protein